MDHARRSTLLIVGLVLFGCCSRDAQQVSDVVFKQPVCLNPATRREFQLTQETKRYEYPDIDNPDGTVTRLLWVQKGQSDSIKEILKGHPVYQALKLVDKRPDFFAEPLTDNRDPRAREYSALPSNEGLMLVGTREQVNAATDLVNYVLTSIPQIEIEARIVEVRENDDFALGANIYALNDRDQNFDPAMPNAPLDPTASLFDRARTRFPIPGITGAAPVLLELGTIMHGVQLDVVIQAMKMLTKTDVLSAPRIAVLNGFKAEFVAGEDVPILKQNVVGTTVTITTEYRQVGIRLIVVPTLVSRDIVRLGVKTKVENVIGTTPILSGNTAIPSPIISVREATTTVDVRDGAAVVIGGLFTTTKAESHDRVPILGEIPLVGMLFGTTRTEDAHTNLLFFIRPRLISPGGEAGAVITPPSADAVAPAPNPFPESQPSAPQFPIPQNRE